ncbi:maleylpyruvate isomerase family mycothiol-dependent enzyme [Geodermatophilus sp. YIM 151500]|uniref:maleylpyruvate isomerase family mycothiol-dependent enzyme n=1 Tax=Geodermatophilus sp. YIM 151500 TaxID=2984531 RepID=UPI0021E393FE|nr:maleylpyruvate isomerase family mycothiol-dependent enzyme [Geodermatophilus sp. YIM 151500]MCV2488227.1 maleylpyruvate isomerase family mycothiol-dependent enzyme [Geodermatophilus sp. YIM 151500]
MTDLHTARRWWADGARAVTGALDQLTDDELGRPSALPGWTRAHVVAHLARNADALLNLCAWARTGVETPMYPSREARDAGIETSAAVPADDLRADFRDSEARLAEAVATLPDDAWTAPVRNGQGRSIAAREIPWMRAKELWVHGVDLDAGLGFTDAPADALVALVDDVLALFASRDQTPDVTLVATDVQRTWGAGAARLEGPVSAVAAWLTRSRADGLTGDGPELPAWL